MLLLEDKTCIVTGASRGIGLAIARLFHEHGANVAICSRSEDSIQAASKEISADQSRVHAAAIDVSDQDQCIAFTKNCVDRFGGIDVLVNCAGIITRETTLELTASSWQEVLNTNLNGTFFMSQLVLQEMVKVNRGSIVNIASQMAHLPHPGAAPSYECSKAAMVALTRHLASEFGGNNIRVNAISPGSISTGLQKDMKPEVWEAIKKDIPLGRLGDVSEAANSALFPRK